MTPSRRVRAGACLPRRRGGFLLRHTGLPGPWQISGSAQGRRRIAGDQCGFEERDFRIRADPRTFFITDHHRGYPIVLVHLGTVGRTDLRDALEQAWRLNAPKRLIAEYDRSE